MGSLNSFFESISKRINQRKEKNHNYFKRMKRGLNESLDDIRQTFKPIKNWEELMELNPDEDSDEENEKEDSKENPNMNLRKSKTTLDRPTVSKCLLFCSNLCKNFICCRCCLLFCFICGWIFTILQLIGIQSGIIILNALLSEIVEEFKLLSKDTPREYNIYEKIEIATYKSIPEIDVGMFFAFVGLIFLKKYGFYCSIIVQILSIGGFFLLFFLFKFHVGNKMGEYYPPIELTVLIVSYILLTFSIGSSLMLALKQFFNLYINYYKKYFNFDIIFCQCCCCKVIIENIINSMIKKKDPKEEKNSQFKEYPDFELEDYYYEEIEKEDIKIKEKAHINSFKDNIKT